ncbi:MAG: hypothetical protein WCE94_00720 [Candidatus Methanoperedens sp.]
MGIIKNEDAQFMLLAGFIIAIGLVITTVMLNNIIFESNMAGEAGGDPIKYDIVNLMRISGDEMKSAYRNTANVSVFTNQMNTFSANLPMLYALHGEGVNVSWDVNNWRNNVSANFTDDGTARGKTNWTVIENVKDSKITINITNISGTFQIGLINISKPNWINLTTITNTPLTFINSTTTDPYSIVFRFGNTTSGNYTITGNTNNSRAFTRSRDYILNATVTLSTSNMRANITIPVSVPW